MACIARRWAAAAMFCLALPVVGWAQSVAGNEVVHAAAMKYAGGIAWRAESVISSDFNCTGKVQYAILGVLPDEILVAIFAHGLEHVPEMLRFDAGDRNILASKIRVDDYSLSAEEIAGVSGAMPAGYRPSTTCHGVRLSDDTSEAAHIYWDHDHQHFDSWTQ